MSPTGYTRNSTANGAVGKYLFVKPAANATVSVASAATDKVVGVSTDIAAADGDRMDVQHSGPTLLTAGAAFSAGDLLMSDASGRGITATAAAGSNVRVGATALEAATAAGDQVLVMVTPGSLQG